MSVYYFSVFTSSSTATILLVVALILNLAPPFTVAPTMKRELKKRGEVFTASNALVERFGLFTIIVLAESILGTVASIAEVKDKLPVAWLAFIVAILISFLLWSIYFDMTSEQETKVGYSYMQWFIFLHFPLLASLSVIGACIKIALIDLQSGLSDNLQWMFCSAMAVILLSIVGVSAIMKEEEEDRAYIQPASRILIIVSILILLVPVFQLTTNTLVFRALIAILLLLPVFWGIRSWVLYKFFRKQRPAEEAAR
jgi:low temperature requirement protein LtrA